MQRLREVVIGAGPLSKYLRGRMQVRSRCWAEMIFEWILCRRDWRGRRNTSRSILKLSHLEVYAAPAPVKYSSTSVPFLPNKIWGCIQRQSISPSLKYVKRKFIVSTNGRTRRENGNETAWQKYLRRVVDGIIQSTTKGSQLKVKLFLNRPKC